MTDPLPSTQNLLVFSATDFVVTDGVAEGDPVSFADELVMDDVYQLQPHASRRRLGLAVDEGKGRLARSDAFVIASETEVGRPGNPLHLDSCLTLMAPDGKIGRAHV